MHLNVSILISRASGGDGYVSYMLTYTLTGLLTGAYLGKPISIWYSIWYSTWLSMMDKWDNTYWELPKLLESSRNASHYIIASHSLIKAGHVYVNIITSVKDQAPTYNPSS
jgi:hypothetical protein